MHSEVNNRSERASQPLPAGYPYIHIQALESASENHAKPHGSLRAPRPFRVLARLHVRNFAVRVQNRIQRAESEFGAPCSAWVASCLIVKVDCLPMRLMVCRAYLLIWLGKPGTDFVGVQSSGGTRRSTFAEASRFGSNQVGRRVRKWQMTC